jgi:Leucine-rich repeat (LRR) protein
MHCNELTSPKGIQRLPNLEDLNLSSNNLITMQGVEVLYKLTHLDLSCNKIQKLCSLKMLQ